MVAPTPTAQRNAVSQGAALGLLLCGCNELPSDKVKVDLAFSAAWRDWGYRGQFPQVSTDIGKGLDGSRALTRADQFKRIFGVHWTMEEGYRHVIATQDPDWTAENPADVQYRVTRKVVLAGHRGI